MQRIQSIDLARGFTVLMIAPIHTVMLYSSESVHNAWLGAILKFIAEGPGAPLFMLLMGISFSLSGPHTWEAVGKRAAQLLLLAYALNLFKFILPFYAGLLPPQLLQYLEAAPDAAGMRRLFLTGDILHFAALTLPVLWVISRLSSYPWCAALLALMIPWTAPLFWDLYNGYTYALIGGGPPLVFFPLLPWLVYPLAGLVIGYCLEKWKAQVFTWLPHIGIVVMLIAVLCGAPGEGSFYRTGPAATGYHLGLVLLWLCGCHWLSTRLRSNRVFEGLVYASRNITLIYGVQWIVICWCLPVFGFHRLDGLSSLVAMLFTTVVTLFISLTIRSFINHAKTKHL